jgi:hypothetical protein
MLFSLASFLLPPLFVFGVYHLLTWFDVFGINDRAFWKRVAVTSAISHVVLASGFFLFAYFDASDRSFGVHLFDASSFWRLMAVFDTAPLIVILVVFSVMDRAGINPPGLVAVTLAITYTVGTAQWFLVGGGLGALFERFFEGLRTPDPEDEEWE